MEQIFDVVVIGGGHAGCEAVLAASRMGASTCLITLDPGKIAEMSCNPSIGGVGKGQLVKELDALGGEMGKNADHTGIQFKRLNTRKGSAVQSSRCQSDKHKYAARMRAVLACDTKIIVVQGEVDSFHVEQYRVSAVKLKNGQTIRCKSAVVTSGTFMGAVMHCGEEKTPGGRAGEASSTGLSGHLASLGFALLRLKTGTPARLKAESIDFTKMEIQYGDNPPRRFSHFASSIDLPQVPCFLTYSSPLTHQVIRDNLHLSPLYSGMIQGIGPRYCPSIEDKVMKFPDKSRHPLFFEPESLSSNWIYPNGVSTSLPARVQEAFLRTIPGCEQVEILRFGYAVEYDCVVPTQLKSSLESREISGLFFGGQVNGTSGYEEAAAQGLIAGANAASLALERQPLILGREESYIGVMIDDLTSQGVAEPYRMFTSRAEYRLSLREDNAGARLCEKAFHHGLLRESDYLFHVEQEERISGAVSYCRANSIRPTEAVLQDFLTLGAGEISQATPAAQLLKRPEIGIADVRRWLPNSPLGLLSESELERIEIEVKYEGYISLQTEEIKRLDRLKEVVIPDTIDFKDVSGLSNEIKEILTKQRPKTLAAAAKVRGVTPAALNVILFHVKQKGGLHVRANL